MSNLVRGARAAALRAHAPYSDFAVGAAILARDGSVVTGANIENVSYPLGVCAERIALLRWRALSRSPVVAIAIYTPTERPTAPCGLCRDALVRWAPVARVVLAWKSGQSGPVSVRDLLPADAPR